ncbi:MAG: NADH-quinone oxidoreductase subunit NuoF [Candidatus Thorarchaeota archaeon]|jgi:NADH:ubiquinone oxidoreductase subunit F (NADH-binding)/(2Fe-2S) ferredoxin/Pyruvate/2-oxoacid:ferredoxin oxidoreductase delta subunit
MAEQDKIEVLVCLGTGCESAKSDVLFDALEEQVKKRKLGEKVEVKRIGCHGLCEQAPVIAIEPEGLFYCQVKPDDIEEIVESHFVNGKPVEALFYETPTGERIPKYEDIPFYSKQHRIVLKNSGHIDPASIDDYIAAGGYKGLERALKEMTPEEVVEEVLQSGLRGRGGAGFPAGLKWKLGRNAPGDKKYAICNADEGDPGAFMDGSILTADPHSVLEGLSICAYAIGADEAYVYVRHEYPSSVAALKKALKDSYKRGYLGKGIMDTEYDLEIHLMEGAGAFVCGEETALMASIEGKRGMPRPRPPFPTESGLWGKPTVINNVKSLANASIILREGWEWFKSIGTEGSSGTAIFSLTGKVKNTGLVEVPMGATLRNIIFDVGGGVKEDRTFKAVQTGGPAGGCLPAEKLDLPVDFDSLKDAGAIMGSGGMIVMDETTCMVDVARYFLSFTQQESCGKCTPCRMGTLQMLRILDKIREGRGEEGDIEKLLELCDTVVNGSLCGLGQNAPNPVLTTIEYFRDEYEVHIKNKVCPSMVCRDLVKFTIDPDKCIACTACKRICPTGAVQGERDVIHTIDQDLCIKCGACFEVCPPKADAVLKVPAFGKSNGGAH